MAKGTKLLVKLEDGNTMEFAAETDIVPAFNIETEGSQHYVTTAWNIRVPVTVDQVKQFANSPIALMRTTVADKEYNMPDPHGRYTKKVTGTASCLLEN